MRIHRDPGRRLRSIALVLAAATVVSACGRAPSPAKAAAAVVELRGLQFSLPGWEVVQASTCRADVVDDVPPALTRPTAYVGSAGDLEYCYAEPGVDAPLLKVGHDGAPDLFGADRPPTDSVEIHGVRFQLSEAGRDDGGTDAMADLAGWRAWLDVATEGSTPGASEVLRSIVETVERPAAVGPPPPIGEGLAGRWSRHDDFVDFAPDGTATWTLTSGCCYPIYEVHFWWEPAGDDRWHAEVERVDYYVEEGAPSSAPPADEPLARPGDEFELTLVAGGLLRRSGLPGDDVHWYWCGGSGERGADDYTGHACGA